MTSLYELELLKKILLVYSPSGREAELASLLTSEMKHLGLEKVHIDPVGNVVGEVGIGRPLTVLCGHMDTVPGFIEVREEGRIIYGRGAVDAKASLAAMVLAASRLTRRKVGKTMVIGVVDEEGDGKGIEYVSRMKLDADYFVFGEPSGAGKITVGYKGRVQLTLTLKTSGGHASAPWANENAVEKAYDLLKIIQSHPFTTDREENDRFHTVSSSPTVIKGGEFPNNIPGNCQITLDIRIPPQLRCAGVIQEINKLIDQFRLENSKISVQSKVESMLDAYEADQSSPLVEALKKSIHQVLGKEARLIRKTGTGDMNVIGLRQQIPVVTYGPGDSRLDHTSNEHINLQEYLASIDILERTLEYIAENN
jgi:[amino group carrier protein]-lysine/ornithine hydrolase